ncbi:MAG: helix-turn-helix transcriptional regulator [Candidatus Falkowbacteria bacterium]
MSFGSRIIQARKEKNMSQEALAKKLSATPTTIGRYERDEVKPSIEVALKIANVLDVSLDYLTGNSEYPLKNKSMLERFNSILNLNDKDKEYILFTMDAMIRDAKTRRAYA